MSSTSMYTSTTATSSLSLTSSSSVAAATTTSSSGCAYERDCSCSKPPPAGLEEAVRCEEGQWVLIGGTNVETNGTTIVIPQDTTVVRNSSTIVSCLSLVCQLQCRLSEGGCVRVGCALWICCVLAFWLCWEECCSFVAEMAHPSHFSVSSAPRA